jgi:hypothetical protein
VVASKFHLRHLDLRSVLLSHLKSRTALDSVNAMRAESNTARMRIARAARIFALLAVAWLAGCDTAPQMSLASLPPVPPDKVRFYVYREPTYYDSLEWTAVSLNGQKLGVVGPGSVFYRDLPPGTYSIEARSDKLYPGQVKTVAAPPGATVFVRVDNLVFWGQSPRQWSGTTFVATIVEPAIGQYQIASLRLTPG